MGEEVEMVSAVVHVPPKIYPATLVKREELVIKDKKSNAETLVWKFFWEVQHGDEVVTLNELCDRKMTPGNKLGKIVKALLNKDVVLGEKVDLDSLVGKRCNLVVEDKMTEHGKASKIANHSPIDDVKPIAANV